RGVYGRHGRVDRVWRVCVVEDAGSAQADARGERFERRERRNRGRSHHAHRTRHRAARTRSPLSGFSEADVKHRRFSGRTGWSHPTAAPRIDRQMLIAKADELDATIRKLTAMR